MKTARSRSEVVWAPHPGSQTLFLSCPFREVLYTGTRGPGKTDALLMDFAQHVGQGYGADWHGILFRHEYKPLKEIIRKTLKWFPRIFPDAVFRRSQSDLFWEWPGGEQLLLRTIKRPEDYWDYHGHEYQWIAFEELTAWPELKTYHIMKSCNRSTNPDVPLKYRATCNPYGPGHNAVKSYFIDPAPPGEPFTPDSDEVSEALVEAGVEMAEGGWRTVTIHGHYSENTALMDADPDYPSSIARAAPSPEAAKAWLSDDWDIVAGGMFDDVWSDRVVIEGWPVADTPASWRLDRAFDWGTSRPFSVGWWAESDGTEAPDGRIYPRGSLIRVAEWYGWNGKPNEGVRMTDDEMGRGIVEREKAMGIAGRVRPGPADAQIYHPDPGRESIADRLARHGARFEPADKAPGSRKAGWQKMRQMLKAASEGDREHAGLYVFDSCRQFIRTIPTLARSERDPDDVDTDAEDHCGDEARYRLGAAEPAVFEGRRFKVV